MKEDVGLNKVIFKNNTIETSNDNIKNKRFRSSEKINKNKKYKDIKTQIIIEVLIYK